MAKFTALFTIAALLLLLLVSFELTSAARPVPTFTNSKLKTVEHLDAGPVQNGDVDLFEGLDDSCERMTEEECLIRRTLTAHVDYIYTQKHRKP